MLIDLLIGALVIGAGLWGYRQGLSTAALAAAGFATGAIIGSRVAPLILDGGLEDPFAPALSLPAAILLGALLAAATERVAYRLRLRLRRHSRVDVVAGAALAACIGLVAVWAVGIAATQVDSFKDSLRQSAVLEQLNATLPPPGPLLKPKERPKDALPKLAGPDVNVGPADPSIRRDPQVRRAARSVVKVSVDACHGLRRGTGTGWVAGDAGIVVTNAHVVRAAKDGEVHVQVRGRGPLHGARTIWFDDLNDLALLRVPAIRGVPKLRLDTTLSPGIYVAAVGFPGGGPLRFTPGRMGNNARLVDEDRTVAVMRVPGGSPGSSGSPAVDRHGRVVTTLSRGTPDGRSVHGVPVGVIQRALGRAGQAAKTGDCL